MKNEVSYTLLADGSSDEILIPIISWVLRQHYPNILIQAEFASLSRLRKPPKKLEDKIIHAIDLYPCDILFIHRDAENDSYEERRKQIAEVWSSVKSQLPTKQIVGVVPVRMSETWLLIDELAIKTASGNPNSDEQLSLPSLKKLESESNPKKLLHDLIKKASKLKGRNLEKLNIHQAVHLVAENMNDFSLLRNLSAFQELENEVSKTLTIF